MFMELFQTAFAGSKEDENMDDIEAVYSEIGGKTSRKVVEVCLHNLKGMLLLLELKKNIRDGMYNPGSNLYQGGGRSFFHDAKKPLRIEDEWIVGYPNYDTFTTNTPPFQTSEKF